MFFPAVAREGEQYGDALLSYYPMRVVKTAGLPGLPGRSLEPRGVLWATVDILGQPLQVMNTHLGLVAAERHRQVEALLGPEWLGHPDCQGPVILCGDLNMSPRSENFGRLTTRLRDVQRSVEGHRPLGTWLSYWPWFRIDHVLVSEDCRVERVQTIRSRLARSIRSFAPGG